MISAALIQQAANLLGAQTGSLCSYAITDFQLNWIE